MGHGGIGPGVIVIVVVELTGGRYGYGAVLSTSIHDDAYPIRSGGAGFAETHPGTGLGSDLIAGPLHAGYQDFTVIDIHLMQGSASPVMQAMGNRRQHVSSDGMEIGDVAT